MAEYRLKGKLTAILAADVARHSRLMTLRGEIFEPKLAESAGASSRTLAMAYGSRSMDDQQSAE